ncbi:hypothetical protein BDM02DRAFT_3267270 [Thelephora ganbajun]|uniref:Uncharacterized protein n=1 Tax=Thelephora ganbajun TaxID=370292 RepID=A0ACB6ZP42_THEGA|nr:hypothetical protein BDM02DRAFT_3267270 [Thelephora ganbajun]
MSLGTLPDESSLLLTSSRSPSLLSPSQYPPSTTPCSSVSSPPGNPAVENFSPTDLEDDVLLTAFLGNVDGKKVLGVGRVATQIVQGLGVSGFSTVASKSEVQTLSTEFSIDARSIVVNAFAFTAFASAKDRLEASSVDGFDLIFNSTGLVAIGDAISSFGLYVHNKETSEFSADTPAVRIVEVVSLVKKHPANLIAHVTKPFKLSPVSISLPDIVRPIEDITAARAPVAKTTCTGSMPAAQLSDPRKVYILVGYGNLVSQSLSGCPTTAPVTSI